MKKKPYKITEDEQEVIGRLMLNAAFAALGKRPVVFHNLPKKEIARRVVVSLNSAQDTMNKEMDRLKSVHGVREVTMHDLDVPHIVGSAFSAWANFRDEIGLLEVHPQSGSGFELMEFAHGIAAAMAMTNAFDLLED